MRVEFQYAYDDFEPPRRAFDLRAILRRRSQRRAFAVFATFALSMVCIFGGGLYAGIMFWRGWLGVSAIPVVVAYFILRNLGVRPHPVGPREAWNQHRLNGVTARFELGANHLVYELPWERALVPWSVVEEIQETPVAFRFFTPQLQYILPKRGMDDLQVDRVRDLAERLSGRTVASTTS